MKNPSSRSRSRDAFTKLPFIFMRSINPAPSVLGLWLIFVLISDVPAHAGDSIADAEGSYSGTANRTWWQTETGSYGGSIFQNGCLSGSSGRYAGKINANGSITRADGSYGGFISNWDPTD